jgi:hypothetical protein
MTQDGINGVNGHSVNGHSVNGHGLNGHGLNGHAKEANGVHDFDSIDDSVASFGPPPPLPHTPG